MNIKEESSVTYLTDYYHHITEEVGCRDKPSEACALAVMLSASLKILYDYYNEFPQALKDRLKSLVDLRQQHLGSLCSDLDLGIRSPGLRKILCVTLECLSSDIDLICTDSGFDEGLCPSRPYSVALTEF